MTHRTARQLNGEQLYRVVTGSACFGIVVESGVVSEAAPIAARDVIGQPWEIVRWRWAAVEAVPPVGWELQEGGGGWRCVNKKKRWETITYTEKAGGAEKAIEAAIELERRAMAYLEEQQHQCLALRSYFAALAGVEANTTKEAFNHD